jgi:hypothetical protein
MSSFGVEKPAVGENQGNYNFMEMLLINPGSVHEPLGYSA